VRPGFKRALTLAAIAFVLLVAIPLMLRLLIEGR
jgi:hypothetical protein